MKRIVKILLYDRQPLPARAKQITIKDPGLTHAIVPIGPNTGWVSYSGWTAGSGSGFAQYDGNQVLGVLSQPFNQQLDPNIYYEVGFALSGVTQGGVGVYIGSEKLGTFSTDGNYTVVYKQSGSTNGGDISFRPERVGSDDFIGGILTNELRINQSRILSPLPDDEIQYYPKGYLDLKEDVSLGYNWQISDVSNLNTSRGAFVKQFEVPGSKNNKNLFGLIHGKNATTQRFNPRNKTRADVIVDDNVLLSGWLTMKEIKTESGEINYQCEVYDSVFGLFSTIKKKKVSDIDISLCDHLLTSDAVTSTWDVTRSWEDVYTYPLLCLTGTDNVYQMQDFSPAFYNKFLLDRIILDANYGWDLSDEADATISKMVTTPSGKRRTADTDAEANGVRVSPNSNLSILLHHNWGNGFISPGEFTRSTGTTMALDNDYTSPNYDGVNSWDTSLYKFRVNSPNTSHTFEFVMNTTITLTSSLPTAPANDLNSVHSNSAFNTPNQIGFGIYDEQNVLIGGGLTAQFDVSLGGFNTYQMPTTYYGPSTAFTFSFSGTITTDNLNVGRYRLVGLAKNDIYYQFNGAYSAPDLVNPGSLAVYDIAVDIDAATSYFKVTPKTGGPITDNQMIRLNRWLPAIGQEQYVNEHMNMFNLYAFEDDNRKIKFITRPEVYSTNKVIDWSGKMEYEFSEKFLTDVTSTKTILGYKVTEDEFNKAYKDVNGQTQYGDFEFDNGSDLFNEVEELRNKVFGSTPMVNDDGGRVVPAIRTRDLSTDPRTLLQGDALYPTNKFFIEYFNPFSAAGQTWTFSDNYYWGEDLGQGYYDNIGFTGSTPHGIVVGDKINVFQQPSQAQIDGTLPYVPYYNGPATVIKVIDAEIGGYGIVINKQFGESTPTTPGLIEVLQTESAYLPFLHIDSLTASTVDINYGSVSNTLLNAPLSMTPNTLAVKYYLDQLQQHKEGRLLKVAMNLSILDVVEILSNIGAKIWIAEKNEYYTIYSINDFDPVVNSLTTVELLQVVSGTQFRFKTGAVSVGPVGTYSAAGGYPVGPATVFTPGPNGGTNISNNYSNVIRGGDTFTFGNGNQTYNNSYRVFVLGNYNNVDSGVYNTFVLGNNTNVTESNSLYLSNYAEFHSYGATLYNVINMGYSGITVGGASGVSISTTGITINGEDISTPTRVQDGINTYTGGTIYRPSVNVVSNPSFSSVTSLSFSGGSFYSGGTNLSNLFALSGLTGLPAGTDGQMFYNSGGTWVRRDMALRVADNASDWVRLGASSNTFSGSPTTSIILGGANNIISGTSAHSGIFASMSGQVQQAGFASFIAGAQNSIVRAPGSSIISSTGSLVKTNTSTTKVYANSILASRDSNISGSTTFTVSNAIVGSLRCTNWESINAGSMYSNDALISNSLNAAVIGGSGKITTSSSVSFISSDGLIDLSSIVALVATHDSTGQTTSFAAIVGGKNNKLGANVEGAVILGCSGVTSTNSYTTYTNNVSVERMLHLVPLGADPTSPVEGDIYFRTGVGPKFFDGAVWRTLLFV